MLTTKTTNKYPLWYSNNIYILCYCILSCMYYILYSKCNFWQIFIFITFCWLLLDFFSTKKNAFPTIANSVLCTQNVTSKVKRNTVIDLMILYRIISIGSLLTWKNKNSFVSFHFYELEKSGLNLLTIYIYFAEIITEFSQLH